MYVFFPPPILIIHYGNFSNIEQQQQQKRFQWKNSQRKFKKKILKFQTPLRTTPSSHESLKFNNHQN
ncbi:hypothetical protein BLA29_012496 [Euroglyphus maynei]|uniref:Uncharacterized protein n=1 Tax=Euroglyphus maynei TaxID=6958 RepID=A0A1Y3B748_EURMA|nr:hypothetical protein BLA29_012496 [Euroglyphus maynei]